MHNNGTRIIKIFILDALYDLADAEPLYKRSLAIAEKALGVEHPDVAAALNNLAVLLEEGFGRQCLRPMNVAGIELPDGAPHLLQN
jgi:hypothetical protein